MNGKLNDRHRLYEEEFNALVTLEINLGTITQAIGDVAMSNFHIFLVGNKSPQTSPLFYQ